MLALITSLSSLIHTRTDLKCRLWHRLLYMIENIYRKHWLVA